MHFLDLFLLNPYIRKKKQKKPEIRNKRELENKSKKFHIFTATRK